MGPYVSDTHPGMPCVPYMDYLLSILTLTLSGGMGVLVSLCQDTNQCSLTSMISLVPRTLPLRNNLQIPFLSIAPTFIWEVTCLLVVKKKQ